MFDAVYKTCRDKFEITDVTAECPRPRDRRGGHHQPRDVRSSAADGHDLRESTIYAVGVRAEDSLSTRDLQGASRAVAPRGADGRPHVLSRRSVVRRDWTGSSPGSRRRSAARTPCRTTSTLRRTGPSIASGSSRKTRRSSCTRRAAITRGRSSPVTMRAVFQHSHRRGVSSRGTLPGGGDVRDARWQTYAVTRSVREVTGAKTRLHVVMPLGSSLRHYRVIEVTPLADLIGERIPPSMEQYLNDRVIAAFSSLPSSPTTVQGPVDRDATRARLAVDGFLDDYDAGSRSLRVVELGFNHVAVTLRVRLRDKQSGQAPRRRQRDGRGRSRVGHDQGRDRPRDRADSRLRGGRLCALAASSLTAFVVAVSTLPASRADEVLHTQERRAQLEGRPARRRVSRDDGRPAARRFLALRSRGDRRGRKPDRR